MIRTLIAAVVLFLSLTAAQAQPFFPRRNNNPTSAQATPAVPANDSWAVKFFPDGVKHDFGNVPWGTQLTHKFIIKNVFDAPFIVESATVSCGCVTPKKPAAAIAPRGVAELEANMDTRRFQPTGQPKVVNIFVKFSSVPEKPGDKVYYASATLTVSCIAKADIHFSSDKIVFGAVNLGQTPKAVLTVEHMVNPAWEITEVVPNENVDVKLDKMRPQLGGQVAYQLTATLKPNVPAGELKSDIQLKTNDKVTPIITVVTEGIVQAPLVASPNNFDVENVKLNEVVTRNVVIRGPGQPFKIVGVEGQGDGVSVSKLPEKAASVHVLRIEFVPSKEGKVSKTLTVKTDLPNDLSATVVVKGAGVP